MLILTTVIVESLKSLVFDPGVSCLLSESIKQRQTARCQAANRVKSQVSHRF